MNVNYFVIPQVEKMKTMTGTLNWSPSIGIFYGLPYDCKIIEIWFCRLKKKSWIWWTKINFLTHAWRKIESRRNGRATIGRCDLFNATGMHINGATFSYSTDFLSLSISEMLKQTLKMRHFIALEFVFKNPLRWFLITENRERFKW